MDNLFRLAQKYSMFHDDTCATSQQVLVTNQLSKNDKTTSSKTSSQMRQGSIRQDNWQQQERLTPLSISYEKLLPQIRDLLGFRWLETIKIDPDRWDWNRRYSYYKDHGRTTEQCKSLHYLVEKLIRVRHLKQYICTTNGQREVTPKVAAQVLMSLATPRVVINYIHGGTIDDKHSTRR